MTEEQAIALAESNALMDLPAEQRAAFQLREERLCYGFGQFQQDVETLLGRPVWTHEFANPQRLIDEAEGRRPMATMDEIIAMIPEEKRIILSVGDHS